jgi:hypothetical protein
MAGTFVPGGKAGEQYRQAGGRISIDEVLSLECGVLSGGLRTEGVRNSVCEA